MIKRYIIDELETTTCCLCGKEFEGHGHNPTPLQHKEGEVCCDECNKIKVIPARIKLLKDEELGVQIQDRRKLEYSEVAEPKIETATEEIITNEEGPSKEELEKIEKNENFSLSEEEWEVLKKQIEDPEYEDNLVLDNKDKK